MTGRTAFLGQAALAGTLVVGEASAAAVGNQYAGLVVAALVAFLAVTLGLVTAESLHEADKAAGRVEGDTPDVTP